MTVDEKTGLFHALAAKIGVKTTMDGQKGTFDFTGTTTALTTKPSIQAPATSVTLEEVFSGAEY